VSKDFDELVDTEGLGPEDEQRLRRVHDLLVEAGPPPDLPPALERPPTRTRQREGEILQFPLLPGRRWAAAAVLAAALAAAAFGAGFLVGDRGGGAFDAERVVPMRGANGAQASIRIGAKDDVGNWPMVFVVSGLPKQPPTGYYNLYLLKNGRPVILCGSFRVHDNSTTVRFTVPYRLRNAKWVVTEQPPGVHEPGRVVLST
jgi:hypothetical protein